MQTSKGKLWVGRILGALFILFMLFDAILHIVMPQMAVDAFNKIGLDLSLGPVLGIFVIAALLLYIIPRTAALGAVLLTAYFGGAIGVQLMTGGPAFNLIFPVIIAVVMWAALLLVSARSWNFFLKRG